MRPATSPVDPQMDDEAASAADIRSSRSKILAGLAKIALCFPMVMLMAIIIYVYYAYVVTYCSTIEGGKPPRDLIV